MPPKRMDVSTVLAGQRLAIKEVGDSIWLVRFIGHDLGFVDLEQKTLQPLDAPGPRLSTISQVRSVTDVCGPDNAQAKGHVEAA